VLSLLAEAAGCEPDAVRGFDLALYDAAPAAFLGRRNEYLASARLDDLAMAHAAMRALLRACETVDLPAETAVGFLADHEEVGSQTAEGAMGAWARDALARICEAVPAAGGLARAAALSMCVSADMAHAVHPNAPEKHDGLHGPRLNDGPVLKTNASRRYATDAETAAVFRTLCRRADTGCQDFVTRADLACGSTIGPLVAAGLGIRTADVGNAMLSMHSVREMAGTFDAPAMTDVLGHFLLGEVALPWCRS
jgi:aspartyl aminopeptidase